MTRADNTAVGLIGQLSETWAATAEVCRPLTPEQWSLPTSCPGWSIKDQVAHLIGTESMLAGRPNPDVPSSEAPHVRNDIGRFNEAWVTARRPVEGPALLDEFVALTAERLATLHGLSEEEWEALTWTPVGQAPYRRFMQIRVFDSWVHEMDIKDATVPPARPSEGPAAEQAVDEVERALGLLVGKRAGAPPGTRVALELTGLVRRDLLVAVNGRAAVVDHFDEPATVSLRMDSLTMLRLACGRVDPVASLQEGQVAVEGDNELGERIVTHLSFTI